MKILSWILKAIAIFYVLGTMSYMRGGDPSDPPPAGAWVLTAVIAGAFFLAALRVDAKIAKDAATKVGADPESKKHDLDGDEDRLAPGPGSDLL